MGGYSKEMPLNQGVQGSATLGGVFMLANAAQGRSLAENHDYCLADRTMVQRPSETPVDADRIRPEHRGQSVYWSIGMSMAWDCGPALGAAAASAEKRSVSPRPDIREAKEV
ncbi:hypothetical protein ACRQ1B_08100 [Rhizobium panacihumi]|uniref:hypothetical protein n=1 Tax=Rhizobium panacihumi TaxID=2008450 RepID=UPI003D7B158E